MHYSVIDLEEVDLLYLQSQNGAEGAPQAFKDLESRFDSMKGRKFYGLLTWHDGIGDYKACIARTSGDDPENLDLREIAIPAGKYARAKIRDWRNNLHLFKPCADEIASRYKIDSNRPEVEFYQSEDELHFLVPIE